LTHALEFKVGNTCTTGMYVQKFWKFFNACAQKINNCFKIVFKLSFPVKRNGAEYGNVFSNFYQSFHCACKEIPI